MTRDNLLGLFRSNIIYVAGALKSSINGTMDYVKITKRDDLTGNVGAWDGPTCGVMSLSQAKSGDQGAFATWICDYESNDANAVTAGGGNLSRQVEEQKSMTSALMPDWVELFQPFDYNFSGMIYTKVPIGLGANLNTTTFGVLDGDTWTFWYQQHLRTNKRFLLKTFKTIDVNSLTCVISS
jgi:hypothetical protein